MRPLEGVRIVDFSRLLPGPMCSWFLRGMGATVTKVEAPEGGDPLRHMPPFGPDGLGAWFSVLNAGVRSVSLDLRRDEGLAGARALIADADIVIEGFRPGVMSRLGLDPEELCREHTALIVASITGYGQTGGWEGRPGHDLGYVGIGGLLSLNAAQGATPAPLSALVADIGGGAMSGAMAILGALLERNRTGKGAWLDVSMSDGALLFGMPWFAGAQVEGQSPDAENSPLGGGLPQYRCYACADGKHLALAALEPKFYGELCLRIGVPMPSSPDGWKDLFRSRDREEWLEVLEGCCVTPVLDFEEVANLSLFRRRGVIAEGPRGVRIRPPLAGCPEFVDRPAPALGADTASEMARLGIDLGQK